MSSPEKGKRSSIPLQHRFSKHSMEAIFSPSRLCIHLKKDYFGHPNHWDCSALKGFTRGGTEESDQRVPWSTRMLRSSEYKEFLSYTLTENGDACLSLLCELFFHFVMWTIHWTASHKQKSGTPTERKTQSWQEQRVVTYPIWASTWR